jgi:hypothetical protein
MRNLQVEELEPRQLLNGTGFSYQPPPPLLSFMSLGTFTIRVAEPAPFVDLDRFCAAPVGPDTPRQEATDLAAFGLRRVDDRPPDLRLAATDSPAYSAPGGSPFALRSPQAALPRGLQPAEAIAGAILPVTAVSGGQAPTVDASRETTAAAVEAVLGALYPRPSSPPPSPLTNQVALAGLRLDAQSLSAVGPPVGGVRERLVVSAMASPITVAPGGAPSEERPALPAPQVSGILATLPPPDLSALKLGMQQFVEQLEQVGQRLTTSRDGMGLCLWIMAGVSAVAACELARRQLVRSQESGVRCQES